MPTQKLRLFFLPFLLAVAGGCTNEDDKSSLLGPPVGFTADFDRDVATDWFDLIAASIDAEDLNAPEASRIIGYAGVTLYESVVPGMIQRKSLGGQLNGLSALPSLPSGEHHWPSIANEALATVLSGLFTNPTTLQAIADLKAQFAADFAAQLQNTPLIDRSIARGATVASRINSWIGSDGFATYNDCAYVVPTGAGFWEPTPPSFTANPTEPCWSSLRTSVLLFPSECAPLTFPTYSTDANSQFAAEATEVYDTVNNLDATQMEIATFWDDGAGTITPPGHWVSITGQVLAAKSSKLDIAAEAYVRLGLALSESAIASWELKYFYNLLRPVTYIQDAAGPINDPLWQSFIETPPFPEFTALHATQSGAAAYVLTNLLGKVSFTDNTYAPGRTFSSLDAAAQEAAISRLYGGIHFRSGIERGVEQGRCIGQTILQNVDFVKP